MAGVTDGKCMGRLPGGWKGKTNRILSKNKTGLEEIFEENKTEDWFLKRLSSGSEEKIDSGRQVELERKYKIIKKIQNHDKQAWPSENLGVQDNCQMIISGVFTKVLNAMTRKTSM